LQLKNKEYYSKIEITTKQMEIGICTQTMLIMFINLVSEMLLPLKKNEGFDIFLLLILKNCSRRMKHKINVTNSAKYRSNLKEFHMNKINYLFSLVQELYIF
jgi:hypothetical protein